MALRLAIKFYETNNNFVTLLRFLECQHADARIVELQQRESVAERARVLRRFKRNEWRVQALALPVSLRVAPASCMSRKTIDKFVMANVLCCLIRIASCNSWCANQREAKCAVVRFIGAVLAVGEDGYSELAAHVSLIDPLMRR